MRNRSLLSRLLTFLLRLFFKLLYHEFAWTYDLVAASVSLGMWKGWVMAALPYLEGPEVLEIGHGPGHLQVALWQKGVKVSGLDESRYMGRQAFKRVTGFGFQPMLVNGYAQFMPFHHHAFSQVVATFPSEYIFSLHAVHEIYRVLKPGGQFVMIPVAWITGSHWYERLAAGLFRVTGQAPDWDEHFAKPFREAGFQLQVKQIELKSSSVLLLIAQKS